MGLVACPFGTRHVGVRTDWHHASMPSSQQVQTAAEAAERLGSLWQLQPHEIDALTALGPMDEWASLTTLTDEQRERTSLLIGMYAALETLYEPELARSWVRLPNANPLFTGRTPVEAMLAEGLPMMRQVRQLLGARAQR